MTDQFNMREDKPEDIRILFKQAQKRRENAVRWHLLGDLLNGKTIDLTKSNQLFEAVNRERMEFEQILNLHPEEVGECIEYVKMRCEEQKNIGGKWWNPYSKARHGEEGAMPPCIRYARPNWYWYDKKLRHNFFNSFPKFRISEKPL